MPSIQYPSQKLSRILRGHLIASFKQLLNMGLERLHDFFRLVPMMPIGIPRHRGGAVPGRVPE